MLLIIGAIFLATAADVAQGRYLYQPQIGGWLKAHRVVATWEEAFQQCTMEGAILASPITEDLQYELKKLFNKASYFIGANAKFDNKTFVSVEGVPLEDMPLMGMYESLDTNDGQCLSMDGSSIHIVPCTTRLPYVCYKQQKKDMKLTEIGTYDKYVAQGRYVYRSQINGWLKAHRVVATWEEALQQCIMEGAILASPITEDLQYELKTLFNKTSFFIGANARVENKTFVSEEGVSLEDMPLMGMYESLDTNDGRCLSMDGSSIHVVPCTARLPYVCYKKQRNDMKLTECGTYDKEYMFEESTGSCYKYHYQMKKWIEAFRICIAEGGYLAIVNDLNEAQVFVRNINDKSRYMMTGLLSWTGNGTWISVHGELVEQIYNVWESDSKPEKSYNSCAYIHPRTGKFKHINCYVQSYFICEKNPLTIQFTNEE